MAESSPERLAALKRYHHRVANVKWRAKRKPKLLTRERWGIAHWLAKIDRLNALAANRG